MQRRIAFSLCFSLLGIPLASAQPRPIDRPPVQVRPELFGRKGLHLYRLGEGVATASGLRSISGAMGLKFDTGDNDLRGKIVDGDTTRGYVTGGDGPRLVVLPDLTRARVGSMRPALATRAASEFVRKFRLEARDDSTFTPLAAEPWRSQSGPEGQPGPAEDRLLSISFARKIGGVETIGPSSILNVQVGQDGVVGVTNSVRRVELDRQFRPKMRSQAEAIRMRDEQISRMTRSLKGEPKVLGMHLAYVDQGMTYVQPAYVWGVEWRGPNGIAANLITIPAFENTPEPIMDMGMKPNQRPPSEGQPRTLLDSQELYASIEPPQANPVQIGMYVVRNDNGCWVDSAWGFWSNVTHGGGPARNLLQYWWDHDYYWQNVGSTSSLKRWVAGQVHVALVEGHGAPWVITALRNDSEIIHLNRIGGFGSLMGGGEKTAYVIWHSCDVVPVPGDPYGWDFSSGTAWDVWWGLFRGMRGSYGYHTTMAICDGVASGFGDDVGRGCPNMASWLNRTGSQWWYRFWLGWDHGSGVLISGHEGDRIYDNSGLPAPGSLTMWWN